MAPVDARWLDTEEQQIWLAVAYTLARLPAALDAQLERDAGINTFEYLVLCGLSMAPDRTLRMSELAEFTASSLSRLSNVVTRLEKRGWLQRNSDPADGRCTLAALTESGWAKVTESAPSHVESVRRLVFDPLSRDQRQQFGEIGRRILEAIDSA